MRLAINRNFLAASFTHRKIAGESLPITRPSPVSVEAVRKIPRGCADSTLLLVEI
jgi:hypothetical protein